VVEGVLQTAGPAGEFHADKVMAKCPSKFEADPNGLKANADGLEVDPARQQASF